MIGAVDLSQWRHVLPVDPVKAVALPAVVVEVAAAGRDEIQVLEVGQGEGAVAHGGRVGWQEADLCTRVIQVHLQNTTFNV